MSAHSVRRRSMVAPLVAVVAVIGCAKKTADDAAKAEPHPVVAASTALAVAQPFTDVVGAIGAVVPRAGHIAVLSAPAATRVANVLVVAGQSVAKGDALVELEQSGFQSALRSAVAGQLAARAARDRWQRLVDQGIAARKDLETSQADLAKADADVAAAQRMMELATLRAPISGIVTRMSASLGAAVDPSQSLVEVADPATLDVLLSVQPGDAARIKSGDKVTLHPGQRATDESFAAGDVVDVAGVVDSASHSVSVRVRTASSKRPLRIGETLFGEIVVATRPRAVTIPIEALVPEGDGFKVFVVDSGDVAHARTVTVGGKTDKVVEIIAGIAVGDRVVTYGAFGVDDGAKIVAAGGSTAPVAQDSAEKP